MLLKGAVSNFENIVLRFSKIPQLLSEGSTDVSKHFLKISPYCDRFLRKN